MARQIAFLMARTIPPGNSLMARLTASLMAPLMASLMEQLMACHARKSDIAAGGSSHASSIT
jgi:hypothetical protein